MPFKSAGNDRNDSTPSQGAQFQYWQSGFPFGSWVNESYDSAIHPKADGWDQGGYDTISAVEIAKNIMTVGAVNDAVTSGQRDPSKATMSSFSCWGPSDDGRIKPDIVANGVGLYSSLSSTNSSYASYSGTSMSSPNACGAAALLLQQHADLFGGQFMRASTLKGLIIHTTDDLGTAGPDYRNGFGLMNTQAAADLMMGAANYPNKDILIEDTVTTSQTIHLCWTDPPGAAQTGLDNTTRILVNDLDLRIIHPNSITIYEPFVLDPLNPTAAATTGDNNLDNVEQVEIAAPPVSGVYTVEVTYKGTLTNGIQDFSLVTTGNSLVATSPVAMDVNEITQPDTPVIITLDATDDGLPNPPSALSYQITSLPNQGTLADPNDPNLPITSVPYALSSDQVIYTPRSGCDAQATFTYIASDGGTSPDGGDSNGATVAVNFEMFVTPDPEGIRIRHPVTPAVM
ncbi:MAG: S8 family serine peptidase [Planctomycetota bacterium]